MNNEIENLEGSTDRQSTVRRLTKLGIAVGTPLASIGLVGGGVHAATPPPTLPADPSGGAIDDTWGSVQDFVVGKGGAVLFGLGGLGILVKVAWKYMRRGANAV